ncbi:MAG: hypothetical protein Q8L14_04065 [Myxococcales bacterium]|nr:hypothetical protein [Myxococcales bacterium]
MTPNLDDLYQILRAWAAQRTCKTYSDLSIAYQSRTGDRFEPHGSWDVPLGELNRRLHSALGAPAISALVVKKDTKEPGGGFWGCATNVPPRPTSADARLAAWAKVLNDVHAYPWPPTYP